jgi:hypothetical protein
VTQDLRRNPRVLLDADVEIVHDGRSSAGRAHDISLGGMFVATTTAASFGSKVTLKFKIGRDELALDGVVRWTRDDGMGVQFGTFGVRETYAITEWVKKHARPA